MVDAQFKQGVTTLNPRLIREGAWLWWNDIAARDMPRGYEGRMSLLSGVSSISNASGLEPGDVAVTGDGSHVIAHVGDDRWIEADPVGLRVTEWSEKERPEWLDRPVYFLRWTCLR